MLTPKLQKVVSEALLSCSSQSPNPQTEPPLPPIGLLAARRLVAWPVLSKSPPTASGRTPFPSSVPCDSPSSGTCPTLCLSSYFFWLRSKLNPISLLPCGLQPGRSPGWSLSLPLAADGRGAASDGTCRSTFPLFLSVPHRGPGPPLSGLHDSCCSSESPESSSPCSVHRGGLSEAWRGWAGAHSSPRLQAHPSGVLLVSAWSGQNPKRICLKMSH